MRFMLMSFMFVIVKISTFAADEAHHEAITLRNEQQVEQWGVFEAELKGPAEGNPFVDVKLAAEFIPTGQANPHAIQVTGFYDGEGIYRIRFMPETTGAWEFVTSSNRTQLDRKRGNFTVVTPSKTNHGPVHVHNTYNFAYADETPFFPFGTTCYAWIHQGAEGRNDTLTTLAKSPFNKVRMCVFPKWYDHNRKEPALYPFAGTAPTHWDFSRFNPAFFRNLEQCIRQLGDLSIQADVILFHPYDGGHWGFDRMPPDADDQYLRYLVARLSAYRNVWWSLANEYDLLKAKRESDWDRFFQIVAHEDSYGHLRSIHNCRLIYNQTNPLVTHASIQDGAAVEDVGRAEILRDVYRKPIIYDEVKYEGNLPVRWGNLSPEELVFRFWNATIAGTYATHGETYQSADDQIWWSHGGRLHGQSPSRIAFLKQIVESGSREGINQIDPWQDMRTAGKIGEYYLIYFGKEKPTEWTFDLPATKLTDPMDFHVEVIDTWNMTITPLDEVFHCALKPDKYRYGCQNAPTIKLPGKPYLALRITRANRTGPAN
jgi:hypothetical protein